MIRRDDEKVDWLKCIGNMEGTGRKCRIKCLLEEKILEVLKRISLTNELLKTIFIYFDTLFKLIFKELYILIIQYSNRLV